MSSALDWASGRELVCTRVAMVETHPIFPTKDEPSQPNRSSRKEGGRRRNQSPFQALSLHQVLDDGSGLDIVLISIADLPKKVDRVGVAEVPV